MPEQNATLSEREQEILRLVATGAPNKEIARQLAISLNTVKVHLRNIFTKIGVSSRTEATLYAVQTGLVKPNAVGVVDEVDEIAEAAPSPELEPGIQLPVDRTAESPTSQSQTLSAGTPLADESAAAPLNGRAVGHPVRQRVRPWQISLLIIAAFLLIGAGVVSARLFLPATQTPVVASQTANPSSLQRWSRRAALPSPRMGMGIVEYEGSFYLVGGETEQGMDGALLRYDLDRNNWQTLSNMNDPVSDIQARLLGEKIYVPGGRRPDGSTSSELRVYDPREDRWESKAPLPIPLSAYAMIPFEGKLYLFGGKSGSDYVSSVYVYDPQEDSWQERASMSSPRAFAAAAVAGNKVYVIGGYDGKQALSLNEAYFPNRDGNEEAAWETFEPMPRSRYAMGAAVLTDIIYLVGGIEENGASADPSIHQYFTKTNLWGQADSPLETVGESPAMLASGSFLYIFGGKTQNGLSAAHQSYQALYMIAVPVITNQ